MPEQVAGNLVQRARRLKTELRAAEKDTLGQAKRQAQALSSGHFRTAQLRKMGHPYATRAPAPPMHPGVINVQSGRFRAAWAARTGSFSGDELRSRLTNASDVARYMRGTSKMIRRPIWTLIAMTIRPVRRSKLRAALRRALHG